MRLRTTVVALVLAVACVWLAGPAAASRDPVAQTVYRDGCYMGSGEPGFPGRVSTDRVHVRQVDQHTVAVTCMYRGLPLAPTGPDGAAWGRVSKVTTFQSTCAYAHSLGSEEYVGTADVTVTPAGLVRVTCTAEELIQQWRDDPDEPAGPA